MTESLLIFNARIPEISGQSWILCRDGRIDSLGQGAFPQLDGVVKIDAGNRWLLPGFIDVHVHGAVGHESMDGTIEALQAMAQFYASHGVTSFLPSTWTHEHDKTTKALETIAGAVGQQPNGATILGAHLEGPFLNRDMAGAQNPNFVRRASRDEALPWLDLGIIRLLAVAPEFEENHWLITECVRRGIVVSAAHTAATYAQMLTGVELGIRQTTHTYNAMLGLHHREPGTVGAAMTIHELNCELIADNIHVHPVSMKILAEMKGRDQIILISDAVRAAGLPDGEYDLDGRSIFVRDGAVRLETGTLAGSILTMDRALANFAAATGWSLADAWHASSLNAARALGMDDRKGSLTAGKDADVVLIDDQFEVGLTVAEGRVVYQTIA